MRLLGLVAHLWATSSAVQVSFQVDNEILAERPLTGKFLHITDFHPDWYYRPGAHLNDFCHVDPENLDYEEATPEYSLSKTKKDHKEARAGYWAPPPSTECDTSIQLVNGTFDYIRREIVCKNGGIDFVIWTGDNARHDNDNRYPRTLKQIYSSNEFMVEKMQDIFGRDKYSPDFIPVVPTLGNNDVYPHNIMFAGPNSKTIASYKSMWKAWIPPEQSHTFDRGGYFHMSVAPKLSVISLNSLYFFENNKAVDGCSSRDEAGTLQLDWLEIQLKLFRQQSVNTWIIGHIPPTERQWYDGCYDRYANLMIEYRDLVIGQLFGHVNIDHFFFLEHKDSTALRQSKSSSKRTPPADGLAEKRNDVHVLKNPLDVLTDARLNFDTLPQFPPDNAARLKTVVDMDSAVGHLAVINVAPSVVPNYFPTIRIYDYLTNDTATAGALQNIGDLNKNSKKNKKKKKKNKKPKKPKLPPVDHLGPGYLQQKYTPMRYVQLYLNTTEANMNDTMESIRYELEYDTAEWPYFMPDLTVSSWVALGNEISGLKGKGKLPKKILPDEVFEAAVVLSEADINSDELDSLMKKKKKKKKKKNKRNNGFWKIFMSRGFVSTGLEVEYNMD